MREGLAVPGGFGRKYSPQLGIFLHKLMLILHKSLVFELS